MRDECQSDCTSHERNHDRNLLLRNAKIYYSKYALALVALIFSIFLAIIGKLYLINPDKLCQDSSFLSCYLLKLSGECQLSPGWMTFNCPNTCGFCELQDPELRCEISKFPQNIATEHISLNNILMQVPQKFPETRFLSKDPFVLELSSFLNDSEIAEFLKFSSSKLVTSTNVGGMDEMGRDKSLLDASSRTSSTYWCQADCDENPVIQNVFKRIELLLDIPKSYYEHLQILRYQQGQYYRKHHDFIFRNSKFIDRSGPRILTVLFYLNTLEANEGGETYFPHLNVSISPRKGNVVLWPNVQSDDNFQVDIRTLHEAKPLGDNLNSVKWAATVWIHAYEYREPNRWGCTGG